MIHSAKQWLAAAPWDSVVALNKALCQAQKLEALTSPKAFEAAQRLWEKAIARTMSLRDAFEVCHDAHKLTPFVFNNGNTFAALGHTLVEDLLRTLPPVEAQIFRTTIGHYICGLISRRELQQVLRHVEPLLGQSTPSAPLPTSTPVPAVTLGLPREQRA